MSTKYREKIQALIDAREKATQGEWSPVRLQDNNSECWIVAVDKTIVARGLNNSGNYNFISLSANTSADIARQLIEAIGLIEGLGHWCANSGLYGQLGIAPGECTCVGCRSKKFLDSLSATTSEVK